MICIAAVKTVKDGFLIRSKIMAKNRFLSREKPLISAVSLFVITTVFYFFGASLRVVEALSLFWPLNAVLAAVFIRYPFLNNPFYYALCYAAMIIYDGVTTSWGTASLLINFSNMVFIITVAVLVQREKRRATTTSPLPVHALSLFNYCIFAAALCALFGAVGSMPVDRHAFYPLFADWFSEQFSTGVLILPCLLSMARPQWPNLRMENLYPLLGVIVCMLASVGIGGAGSLAFPLPALIWCATRYPLPFVCLITLITGMTEIVLVANSIIEIHMTSPLYVNQMFSARLGIATIALCPLMVSVSVETINALVRKASRRADYDYLTQVLSRSGIYEKLRNESYCMAPSNRQLAVMLLDIDHFKNINDTWGHDCGDKILAEFAAVVNKVVGDKGWFARMGGEEFAIVCPAMSNAEAIVLGHQVRERVEHHQFAWKNHTHHITVSLGLSWTACAAASLETCFNAQMTEADRYLYQAKQHGRNQLCAQNVPVMSRAAS
ncbi:diguanylate cyclase (GGDEF)-like protein [Mangrovibacter plantisponsor]|uniref:diguanylate cyclase n=2 Tax=Mangrovibacter plantisponsor TaxID=451513 RepID=A0A317Q3E9_9ENTR|nr:diguanylate cyclase (GGDEF)-like protein [Mangrovibacter plantisponsor]